MVKKGQAKDLMMKMDRTGLREKIIMNQRMMKMKMIQKTLNQLKSKRNQMVLQLKNLNANSNEDDLTNDVLTKII